MYMYHCDATQKANMLSITPPFGGGGGLEVIRGDFSKYISHSKSLANADL